MMEFLLRPVMNTSSWAPALIASSTAYWISGLSTTGNISIGLALVAGRKRVPSPATGNTALRILIFCLGPADRAGILAPFCRSPDFVQFLGFLAQGTVQMDFSAVAADQPEDES